jgi:hypothetical protein
MDQHVNLSNEGDNTDSEAVTPRADLFKGKDSNDAIVLDESLDGKRNLQQANSPYRRH